MFSLLFWLRVLWAAICGFTVRLFFRLTAFVVTFVATALVLVVMTSMGARLAVPVVEGRLDDRWRETLESLSTLTQRVPHTLASPTALALEANALELGLDLVPVGARERVPPSLESSASIAIHKEALEEFSTSVVRSQSGLPALPPDLIFFLRDARGPVDRMIGILEAGMPPRWEVNLEAGYDAPIPNLAGHRTLHRVLAAEAVLRWSEGDSEGAASSLGASWRLLQPTLQRAERRSLLGGLEDLRLLLATIRGMDPPPRGWRQRLEDLDLQTRYRHTLLTEAFNASTAARTSCLLDLERWWVRYLVHPLTQPFQRFAVHHRAEAMRWAAEQLARRPVAEVGRGTFAAELRATIPRWNSIARADLPAVEYGWHETLRAAAGVELTGLILEVHELDAAGDRLALDRLDGTAPSCVNGLSWRVTVAADRIELELDGDPLTWPDDGFVGLPLRASVALSVPPLPETEVTVDS